MKKMTGVVKRVDGSATAYVEVTRMLEHAKYLKRLKRTKTFVADNSLQAKVEDKVVLVETRPMSKNKVWKVDSIV